MTAFAKSFPFHSGLWELGFMKQYSSNFYAFYNWLFLLFLSVYVFNERVNSIQHCVVKFVHLL